jgi:acetyl-CoA carboxylase alpha subunit
VNSVKRITDKEQNKDIPTKGGACKNQIKDDSSSEKVKKATNFDNLVHRHTQTMPVEFRNGTNNSSPNEVTHPAASTSSSNDSDSKQNIELLQNQLEESRSKLTGLRNNVSKLLQTILPDLQVDNLAYIDAIVSEMVRVNGDDEARNGEATNGESSVAEVSPPDKEVKKEKES